jgi:excisionase family DNA binding protein
MEQLMYRPAQAARVLGLGRTAVFGLIKSGRLPSIKLGGARLISADALRALVRELEQESGGPSELDAA